MTNQVLVKLVWGVNYYEVVGSGSGFLQKCRQRILHRAETQKNVI